MKYFKTALFLSNKEIFMRFLKAHKILIFYVLVILAGILSNLVSYGIFTAADKSILEIRPEDFTNGQQTLSYRLLVKGDEKRMSFYASIEKAQLDAIPGDDGHLAVIVYHLNCEAYSAYFNEKFLGTVGDMETGRSNIWNTMNYFFISKEDILQTNRLRLDTLSDYQSGLSSMPVMLMPASQFARHLDIAEYFTTGINLLALGLTLFSFLVTFMLFLFSIPKNTSFLFFSAALLFLGLYTFDYTRISSLPFDYLVYKKLIMGALYSSIAFASLGMYKFFNNKADLVMAVLTLFGYALAAFFSADMITFKSVYNYYNLIVAANLVSWLYTTQKHFRQSDEAKMFFLGAVLLLIFTILSMYSTLSGNIFILNSPFVYAFIFSMTAAILFFREFLNKDMQIQIVNSAHKESYLASITDGMTGLYNHRYLRHILHQTHPPYSVAMIDIDDFKEINDSFGHRFGDEIIRFLASSLTNQVRSSDYVFRYGGDEFFIIFPGCSAQNAREVVLKIKRKINENSLMFESKDVPITFSGGVYYVETRQDVESILDRVDNPLYKSKKEGKNKVTIYSDIYDSVE